MRQRLDIADVEAKTKIRAKYLRALENEEFSMLPGPTFVKTFLRTYAEALGLDPHVLVEEYRAAHEAGEEIAYTTDAQIAAHGWVLLEDDKKLQLADNIAPVVREDLLSKAPADFRTLINSLAPKLTTAALTEMNRKADVDRQDPKRVAGDWLK